MFKFRNSWNQTLDIGWTICRSSVPQHLFDTILQIKTLYVIKIRKDNGKNKSNLQNV